MVTCSTSYSGEPKLQAKSSVIYFVQSGEFIKSRSRRRIGDCAATSRNASAGSRWSGAASGEA